MDFDNNIITALALSAPFFILQIFAFFWTIKKLSTYDNFFKKEREYSVEDSENKISKLTLVGGKGSELNKLLDEINHYISKTKGTTDFAIIQNKVERRLEMRLNHASTFIAFPTYLGLMGTFAGVFYGILTFMSGIDSSGNVTDESIKNLLTGVLVSMSTSLIGLLCSTINNGKVGWARKHNDEAKNEFYDFIQTELMPVLDVSMVTAITKLHQTVDNFEPAFNRVITSFQNTFDKCTRAFGHDFEQHVMAVSDAVKVMGKNMDRINQNIELQEKVLSQFQSDEFIHGMDKYIEAANHFVGITQSLNKFEEARRMMLAAAQESINLQNQYNEALNIPREVAIRINQILDRIKDFEKGVNEVGRALNQREILGNDVVEKIKQQINGISHKSKIADRFLDLADDKLQELYQNQTKVIKEMNDNYRNAISGHIEGFENMLAQQTAELEKRHRIFLQAIEARFNVEDIRKEFTNLNRLSKLEDIETQLTVINDTGIKSEVLQKDLANIQEELVQLKEVGKLGEIESHIKYLVDKVITAEDIHTELESIQKELSSFKKELSQQKAEGDNSSKKERGFWHFGN